MQISLVFYILAINTWTSNLKIQYHSQSLKKMKYLDINLINMYRTCLLKTIQC